MFCYNTKYCVELEWRRIIFKTFHNDIHIRSTQFYHILFSINYESRTATNCDYYNNLTDWSITVWSQSQIMTLVEPWFNCRIPQSVYWISQYAKYRVSFLIAQSFHLSLLTNFHVTQVSENRSYFRQSVLCRLYE